VLSCWEWSRGGVGCPPHLDYF